MGLGRGWTKLGQRPPRERYGEVWGAAVPRPPSGVPPVSSMAVGVEDATSSASITLRVRAHTTVAELKEQVRPGNASPGAAPAPRTPPAHPELLPPPQVFRDYGFHPLVQRWIIGQCLCVDDRTVSSYGVRRDGDTAYLYLLSASAAQLTEQRYEEDQARVMLSATSPPADGNGERRKYNTLPSVSPKKGWGCGCGCGGTGNCGVVEWLGWEGPLKDTPSSLGDIAPSAG